MILLAWPRVFPDSAQAPGLGTIASLGCSAWTLARCGAETAATAGGLCPLTSGLAAGFRGGVVCAAGFLLKAFCRERVGLHQVAFLSLVRLSSDFLLCFANVVNCIRF